MINLIQSEIQASIDTKRALLAHEDILRMLADLVNDCLTALKSGGKIIFAGNGGSFGDAQHLSAELTSRFKFDRAPLASIALGTNSSAMSAIGNDYGYDEVFARELRAIGNKKDIFIPITTSGDSPNILKAIDVANELGIKTVGLTGAREGKIDAVCGCIFVPSTSTARIQESHILIGHILCGLVEEAYFKS